MTTANPAKVAKSASRIALYMMRENEPPEGGARAAEKLEKGGGRGKVILFYSLYSLFYSILYSILFYCKDPVQHSHDFFVISSCKVKAKFKERLDVQRSKGQQDLPMDLIKAGQRDALIDCQKSLPEKFRSPKCPF